MSAFGIFGIICVGAIVVTIAAIVVYQWSIRNDIKDIGPGG